MANTDSGTAATGRRRYLAAVAATVGLGGCLQFSEAGETGDESGPASDRADAASRGTTARESTAQSRAATDTAALPDGTRWLASAQAPFVAGPLVVDGTVVATSVDRHVYGFDAETGAQRWTVTSEAELEKGLSAVDGVAVAAGFDEQLGVAVEDGTVTYRKQEGHESGVREQVAADGAVFQCGVQGVVRAVDPTTGEYRWTATGDGPRVAVDHDGDTVCVGVHPTGHHGAPPWAFAGFDAATGDRLWYVERDLDASTANPRVAVAGGTCLAYSGGDHHMLVDARSGEVRREVTDSGIGRLYGTAGETIVVSRGTELAGLDGASGDASWTSTVGPGRYDAASLDGGTFWALSEETLYRTDAATGEATTVGDLALGGAAVDGTGIGDGLAVNGDTAFVTTADARLRALELP